VAHLQLCLLLLAQGDTLKQLQGEVQCNANNQLTLQAQEEHL